MRYLKKFNESVINKNMNREKIVSKGYTLSVTSWENDGDYYKTESMTFDSKELAISVAKMCRDLFRSKNRTPKGGIGNSHNGNEARTTILEYMKNHPELYEGSPSDNELVDICKEYNSNLLGCSEFYYSRVFERSTLTYSPEDVYLEKIIF